MKNLLLLALMCFIFGTEGTGQSFSAYKDGSQYGFKDKDGDIVILPKYEDARSFTANIAAVKLKGKWGYIDITVKEVIPFKYEGAFGFSEGLAPVKLKGKWGFIDKTDKEIIPFRYDIARNFSEGLAHVKLNGKWGFIDETDKEIIPFKYEDAYNFYKGLAPVKLNGKWGFIDKTDKEIIPFKYEDVGSFSEGLAKVKLNGKYGFIDKTGKEVIPLKYENAVIFEGFVKVKLNGKWGYIDKANNIIIKMKYNGISSFSENLAEVYNGKAHGAVDITGKEIIPLMYTYKEIREKLENKFHVSRFVDKKTQAKYDAVLAKIKQAEMKYPAEPKPNIANEEDVQGLPKVYWFIRPFRDEGRFSVRIVNLYGLKSMDGTVILPAIYGSHEEFNNCGLAKVWKYNEKHGNSKDNIGVVNTKGEYIIPVPFGVPWHSYGFYSNCMAFVRKSDTEWNIIDADGKNLRTLPYDNLEFGKRYENTALPTDSIDYIIAVKGGKYGVIDGKGDEKVPLIYDDLLGQNYRYGSRLNESSKWIIAKKDGKYGVIAPNGKVMIPLIYDNNFSGNSSVLDTDLPIPAKFEGKWGYIDINGKAILPFQYDHADKFSNETRLAFVSKNNDRYQINEQGKAVGMSDNEKARIKREERFKRIEAKTNGDVLEGERRGRDYMWMKCEIIMWNESKTRVYVKVLETRKDNYGTYYNGKEVSEYGNKNHLWIAPFDAYGWEWN